MSVEVTVQQGGLAGKECVSCNGKKYYSFEGIPYAKPPVGQLRFHDPQEPESWSGIRDATKPGNKCAQMDPYSNKTFDGSEDCLYLNVYTPCLPGESEKLPVIMFVHGGRFLIGHGNYYQPDFFVENNVILVTINYRLHILGFLCLHTPEVPGNAAFKDTLMALKWIKKNIQVFNGDDANVTAMGESAGAGLVTSYITSKMAEGLVDKIIGQSGICLSDLLMIQEDPIEKARNITSILGKELTDVKDLYEFFMNAPIEQLLFATAAAEVNRPPHVINSYFLPVIEREFPNTERFFEEFPLVTMKENRHRKMPILIGHNSHEGALFLRRNSEGNIEFIKDVEVLVPRYLNYKYGSSKSVQLAKRLHKFYFGEKSIDENSKQEYVDFLSDAYFNRDIVTYAEIYGINSNDLYFYKFSYAGNMNTKVMKSLGMNGATHGDMIQYQFYKKNKMENCDEKDREMVKMLNQAWCNFVRNGKPTWSNGVDWPPYTQDTRLCLHIDKDLTVAPHPDWDRIKFWIDNMGERSKL